jgi:hypothetical protein
MPTLHCATHPVQTPSSLQAFPIAVKQIAFSFSLCNGFGIHSKPNYLYCRPASSQQNDILLPQFVQWRWHTHLGPIPFIAGPSHRSRADCYFLPGRDSGWKHQRRRCSQQHYSPEHSIQTGQIGGLQCRAVTAHAALVDGRQQEAIVTNQGPWHLRPHITILGGTFSCSYKVTERAGSG